MLGAGIGQPFWCDHFFQIVQTQVGGNGHAFNRAACGCQCQCVGVEGGVERQSRARHALAQGVGLYHAFGQHGDFVAWHVHRAQTLTRNRINGIAWLHGQARCRNVNANGDAVTAQPCD